jgi:hypothetical protein
MSKSIDIDRTTDNDSNNEKIELRGLIERKQYLGIMLKSRYSFLNLLSIPLVQIVATMISIYSAMQTVFLLRDSNYFNIPQDQMGNLNAQIIFYE